MPSINLKPRDPCPCFEVAKRQSGPQTTYPDPHNQCYCHGDPAFYYGVVEIRESLEREEIPHCPYVHACARNGHFIPKGELPKAVALPSKRTLWQMIIASRKRAKEEL